MYAEASSDYLLIEKALHYLAENYQDQPDLAKAAEYVGLSDYHFQRVFTRWAGISPKKFVQFLTIQHAKQVLAESKSLLEATFDTGLSSPGRLHDLFVTHEAITPGEYKQMGEGLRIKYGFQPTPFGESLLAMTDRGICHLSFVQSNGRQQALQTLSQQWSKANIVEDVAATRPYQQQIFNQNKTKKPLHLHIKGTNFQIRVWSALMQIPAGALVSYGTLAHLAGKPQAARAVGTAVGHNPIAYLIPCHRVIRQLGEFGSYHWGATRKKAIIGWEAAAR